MLKEVLVVEDDPESLEILARFLELEGFRVRRAENGADALKQILTSVPDLILSDVKMPKCDGYKLVRQIRSNPRTELLPVILITALDEKPDRIEGFRTGADAYITKPVDLDELKAVVENILARVERTRIRYAELIDLETARGLNARLEDLTETENRVAGAVARGLTNKEIAAEFNNSVRTIENHISRILAKKNLSNRVEIARLVLEQTHTGG